MNKPNDLLSSGEPSGADLAVELVDGAANGVLGVGDFALANTEERGDIAAGTAGDGGVGDTNLADGFDLELEVVGSHGGIPFETPIHYMRSRMERNEQRHLSYASAERNNRRMHKRTISAVLTALMERTGMNQTSLSKATGVGQTTIHRILSGDSKDPQHKSIAPLAAYFGISTDQLRGAQPLDIDSMPLRREDILRRSVPDLFASGDEFVELPFISRIGLAGDLRRESVELTGEVRKITQGELSRCGVERAHAAFFRIQGDTMAPVFIDGSIAGINMAATDVVDGKVYAVQINGEIWIKRVYRIPGGGIRLSSYDLDVEDMRFSLEAMRAQQIAVVGRVFYNVTCYA